MGMLEDSLPGALAGFLDNGVAYFTQGQDYNLGMGTSIPDYALLEKAWRWMYRPRLFMEHRGTRKVEDVAIHYKREPVDPFLAATTASITWGSDTVTGKAKYIRAWVYNEFGATAEACEVFVERIWLDGRLQDDERSPLHWTDLDNVYLLPQMKSGYRFGHYIDICAADSVKNKFGIISQKALKGYHRFGQSGLYKLEVTAEAHGFCRQARMTITLRYSSQKWNDLHVVSVSGRKGLYDFFTSPPC